MTPRAELFAELAALLGVEQDDLPEVFQFKAFVKILKIGIDADMRERYPDADPVAISDWLKRYTTSEFYLGRMTNKRATHRHDLDGKDMDRIPASARKQADRMYRELTAYAEPKKEAAP